MRWLVAVGIAAGMLGGWGTASAQQCRVSILVAYYSVGGHTGTMAEAVASGARATEGVVVTLRTVEATDTTHVLDADAIVVGSPVYNANVAPPVQQFINRWPFDGRMRNKVGAAFVSAGGISAGEETTQLSILRSMLIYGMIVVGGPDWPSAFGASAITEEEPFVLEGAAVAPQFEEKAAALGTRVADVARLTRCGPPRAR